MVKAQVHTGGRGKAGGVKFAADVDAVREHAGNILGLDIKGHIVEAGLDREGVRHRRGVLRQLHPRPQAKKHLGMLSAEGGVEIETVAEENPDAIAKIWVDPVDGLTPRRRRDWVAGRRPQPRGHRGRGRHPAEALHAPTPKATPTSCEINPLILTPEGVVHVLDAKVTLDGNCEFRHPDYAQYDDTQPRDERETAAHEKGLQYVGLEGSVGVIANGAGLAMSTVDVVNQVGGKPANFLDIGGGANADVMAGALEVINNDPDVQSPSSSTSSAASPGAKRSPTASSRPCNGSTSTHRSSSASTAPTPTRVGRSSNRTCPTR